MSNAVTQPLNQTLQSGFITQGPRVEEFEEDLTKYLGCENDRVLSLNSATSGLTLAVRILRQPIEEINWKGLQEDDEVLSPALTCFATNAAILANGMRIKWIDVDPRTCNVDIEDIKSKLSPKTKIIMVVHWGGYPVDLNALSEVQDYCLEKYGFRPFVIEDCAHAFGAEFNGRKLGNHGNICVFSFQAIKHLTTGDGGMIVVPNQQLYEKAKLLRWFGIDRDKRNYKGKDFRLENDIADWGYKYHMNDINATIGIHNLKDMDTILKKDQLNADYLREHLDGVPGITLMESSTDRASANWLFTIRVHNKVDFMKRMEQYGVMTSQVHNRNDGNTCVADFKSDLPTLDWFENEVVCLPVGWWLSLEDLDHIIDSAMKSVRID